MNHPSNDVCDHDPYTVWHLLRIARSLGVELRNRELEELGITRAQATLFLGLRAAGEGATIAQLARWTLNKPHGVSALVGRLERQGYVTRVHDAERRNLVRVLLTDKGRIAYDAAYNRESVSRFIGALTDEQRQSLEEALRVLIEYASRELHLKQPPVIPTV